MQEYNQDAATNGSVGKTETTAGAEGAGGLLEIAQAALNDGDVVGMLRALTESGFLEGRRWRMRRDWSGKLPPFETDDCIAQAVDSACAACYEGRPIRNLGGWLTKASSKIAFDRWSQDYALRVEFDDAVRTIVADETETDAEREERQHREDALRDEAVRIARKLLPRIGRGQIVDVMELVIDAAADGLPDLSNTLIAETLGLSTDAVRSLLTRGFRRLRRVAEEEGVEFPTDLLESYPDE